MYSPPKNPLYSAAFWRTALRLAMKATTAADVQQAGKFVLTTILALLLALPASFLPVTENALGLGRLLQTHHEALDVIETVVQNLLVRARERTVRSARVVSRLSLLRLINIHYSNKYSLFVFLFSFFDFCSKVAFKIIPKCRGNYGMCRGNSCS